MTLQYALVGSGENQTITVFVPGETPLAAGQDHPNFEKIVEGARSGDESVADLFDVAATVEKNFRRLGERVSVQYGEVYLDGDKVDGVLQRQIIHFVQAGEDFDPLVRFYERLVTNPLGDVRDSLFEFISYQHKTGTLTITPEGKVLGYKAVIRQDPQWRTDVAGQVFVPSRVGEGVVNGIDVAADQYIEQVEGDVVEMPRSKVLHEPSRACGDGLHIGTWSYASTFLGSRENRAVMLVEFDPRDVVSVPSHDAKIRVCRYTVIGEVEEPLDKPVYQAPVVEPEPEPTPEPVAASPFGGGFYGSTYVEPVTDDDEDEYDCEDCEDSGCDFCDEPYDYDDGFDPYDY